MPRNSRHLLYASIFALPFAIGGVPAAHADDYAFVLLGCATSAGPQGEPKVAYVQTTEAGSVTAPAIFVGASCSDAVASLLRPGSGLESSFFAKDQFFVGLPGTAVMMYQVTINPFD